MVLRLAEAPASGLEAVAAALHGLAAKPRRQRLRNSDEASPPVPIYVLAPQALDEAWPLADAVHAGWHYVARRGQLEAAVELAFTSDGELRFSRLRTGRRAHAVLRTARRAEAEDGGAEVLEVRILRIPPLHLEALWLAGDKTNLFLPLDRRRKAFPLLDEARARRGLRWAVTEPASDSLSD